MVLQGNNHPSIIGYGYFNEPVADFGSNFSKMKQIVDSINPLLKKYSACNGDGANKPGNLAPADFLGYQYIAPPTGIPVVGTEYLGFGNNPRGDAAAEENVANDAWAQYQAILNDAPRSGGGVLWCLKDYWGWRYGSLFANDHLGIIDQCFVPKRGYYLYRKNITGKADDNPISGTATKVSLEPDLTYLRADGTDISRVIIASRNNDGKCISSNAPVTLSLSGSSCTLFGPTTVNLIAGKLGVVLKSTETVGATTVTATSNNLASSSITITTYPAVDISTTIQEPHASNAAVHIRTTVAPVLSLSGGGISRFPISKGKCIQVYDVSGRLVASARYPVNPGNLRRFSPGGYVIKVKKIDKE